MPALWKPKAAFATLPQWCSGTFGGIVSARAAAHGAEMVERAKTRLATPDAPTVTDAVLVQAARAGDRRACFVIWSRYTGMVERLVRRFFGPGPDYQDVCQEVFLRVFRRLGEVREPAALAGFVVSVTLGVARNQARRRRIRSIVGLSSDEVLPHLATPAVPGEAREAARSLYQLLDKLSAQDRSLFLARFVEKMEIAEVAAAHGMSHSTTKRRLACLVKRMHERLRRIPALRDYVDDGGPEGDA
jgi:RNA polymerase sigma-70 factor (ECF subfamily)